MCFRNDLLFFVKVHKATADVEGGRALYEGYSAVTADGTHDFLRLRETVLLRKEARKMFVQANTFFKGLCLASFLQPYIKNYHSCMISDRNTDTHIHKWNNVLLFVL